MSTGGMGNWEDWYCDRDKGEEDIGDKVGSGRESAGGRGSVCVGVGEGECEVAKLGSAPFMAVVTASAIACLWACSFSSISRSLYSLNLAHSLGHIS